MANFGLTTSGFRPKTLAEIINELNIAFRSEFGEEANVDPETAILGQIIGIYGEREATIWDLGQAIYNAAYPDTAEGTSLDNVAAITAIERLPASRSTVVVRCNGTAGTALSAGRIVSVVGTGARFQSIAAAVIGGGGFVDVDFESVEEGVIQAPAGTLTVIETPVTGWNSCINNEDADLGRDIESDAELRARRQNSLRVVGAAAVDAIRARILDEVADVTDVLVFENETDFTDIDGRPPHSIQVIAAGGLDQDIADKIWEVKAGGIQTYGTDVSLPVIDSQGIAHTINFDRASELRVFFHIRISVGAAFNQGSQQRDQITITSNDPGDTITLSINGRDFVVVAGATAAITAQLLSDAVQAGGADWVPVTASQDTPGTDDYIYLESDYEGVGFIFNFNSASGNTVIDVDNLVLNSGDQISIQDNVIEFAEGDEDTPKEQTIGADVYRSRYFTPINETGDIQSIEIFVASGTEASDYWPTTAPPGGGDWSAADITVAATEVAQFDTLRVTVEIVP